MGRVAPSVASSFLFVPSNSEDAGSCDSRTEVADVDGVNRWGLAKMQETLFCAGDCLEGALKVPATFVSIFSSERSGQRDCVWLLLSST